MRFSFDRTCSLLMAAVLSAPLSAICGCATLRDWQPFANTTQAIDPTADKQAVVTHLNRNIERCTGWHSDQVKVRGGGMPLSLNATVTVQSPRNFRMVARAFSDEADFGSNGDRMWFWIRRAPEGKQYIYTCSHEDLPAAKQNLPIPFQPDWLMEVLGVIPLNADAYEMIRCPGDAGQVQLVSRSVTPSGQHVLRMLTVETKRGVITAHTLRDDGDGHLIAEAKLSDYEAEKTTGVLLPHRIDVSWPETKTDMTLTLGHIEVNPTGIPTTVWNPQQIADCPTYDFGKNQFVERL